MANIQSSFNNILTTTLGAGIAASVAVDKKQTKELQRQTDLVNAYAEQNQTNRDIEDIKNKQSENFIENIKANQAVAAETKQVEDAERVANKKVQAGELMKQYAAKSGMQLPESALQTIEGFSDEAGYLGSVASDPTQMPSYEKAVAAQKEASKLQEDLDLKTQQKSLLTRRIKQLGGKE